MAEAAASAGWGTVAILENKKFTNVSGTDAEKEMKTQKIRKALKTFDKERRQDKGARPGYGPLLHKKRQGGAMRKKFAPGPFAGEWKNGYGGLAAMDGQRGRDGYGVSYGGGGGFRGHGSYSYRGAGGSRGGTRPPRTCHRCKSTGHLVVNCPVPAPRRTSSRSPHET